MLRMMMITAAMAAAGNAFASTRPDPGAVTPERLKVPSGPSSVRGLADEPSVDPFYAAVNYQVPIELPAGRGGLSPRLALTYSGALGNGPMGIGWTLAQPKIQRTTRFGVPRFDATDELELSGIASGRLVAIGGGEYRVEGFGQTIRVKAVDGGFELDDGAGRRYRLGTSAASRQERDATHVLAWLVETETNAMGEQVRYSYTRDRNQVYLTGATWGPGDAFHVALDYTTRGDATRSYRGGFEVVTAKLLSEITVTAFATELRAYQLGYDSRLAVARLASVTSTGRGGNGSWPVTTFTYATTAAPVIAPIDGIGAWRLNTNGATLVDLDGDGAAELVQLTDSGHTYRSNRNGSFGAPAAITGNAQALPLLQLQDVDGDARAELLQDGPTGWSVWKFSRGRWLPQTGVWPGTVGVPLKQPATTRFADLNGDGLVDAIQWNNDGLSIRLATTTALAAARATGRIGGTVLPTLDGRFQDTNGDGLDDYILAAADHLDVFVGRGDGTFDASVRVAYPFAGPIATPDELELGDLDRDGLIDLVRIEPGNVKWYRGRPDGTFDAAVTLANPEPPGSSTVVALADLNGNGSTDVVWSSAGGMWRLDLAGATTAGMLVGVSNGLGMTTTFEYQSSHALAIAATDPWQKLVPIAMPVPTRQSTELGAGETTRRVTYSVRDGAWDNAERRFAGFLTTIVTTAGATPAETSTVSTRYLDVTGVNRVLRGRAQTVQVFDGTGKRLSLVTNTWATMAIAGLPDVPLLRRAILKETRTRHEETAPIRETKVASTFDDLGRAKRMVDDGRLDVTGDESVRDVVYADDSTTWVRDRVCDETVSDLAGVIASRTQTLYGDATKVEALCVVGHGWTRAVQRWLATENRFVTQSQTAYDANGNPTAVVTNGVERRYVYDADALFPIEEHLTTPGGGELVWRATWDRVIGALTALVDPNGHTVSATYDTLGRPTGSAVDDRPAHQAIEYDWTAPFPKTTVWTFDGPADDLAERPAVWTPGGRWRQSVEVANGRGEVRYRALRLAPAQWIVSDYRERDPNSRVVFAGRPVVTSQLELSARPGGIVGDTLKYDPLGRPIEQQLPTGARRTYSYAAFERTMQEPDLAPVRSVLDGQGRAILTERTLPDGTREVVEATYDPAGRPTRMKLGGAAVVRDFTYDTLGRLVQSRDPDLGTRTLAWTDGDRLATETNGAAQTTRYTYDALGRLATRDTGSIYRFHYDAARPGAGGVANLAGRLAWVEEPTGTVDLGYDELGREVFRRRVIDGRAAEATTRLAASGALLGKSYDDGFAYSYQLDPAGRVIGVDDLWTAVAQDAAGQPLHERAGNGVDTVYERDALGLLSRITIRDPGGAALYDVEAARNAWTGIESQTDRDATGLDHTAQFHYDGFARLTGATTGGFTFGYAYDALHNMTSRTIAGPRALGAFAGAYRYGEGGRGPRQLTSIADASGGALHAFAYDAAGRQTSRDGAAMTYDAADRLLRVDGLAGGTLRHAYGHDGARVETTAPDGTITYLFDPTDVERGGVREHDVLVGARVVARVAIAPDASGLGGGAAQAGGLALAALTLLFAGGVVRPRRARQRLRAAGFAVMLAGSACAPISIGAAAQAASTVQRTTFLHVGFGAGPVLFTDETGSVLEERRYEPFGAPIDARVKTATGYTVGAPDLVERDLNPLNKRTEAATGWSDHGARWLAPETARWLTPDPPVESPDAKFMFEPWALHPYQYVDQNPVAYWDPDGREPESDSSIHAITVTSFEILIFNGSRTYDLSNGRKYNAAGVNTPNVSFSHAQGLVIPVPGSTAHDVLTGFSAGFSVDTPIAGVGFSFSWSTTGVTVLWSFGAGAVPATANMNYTWEDDDKSFMEDVLERHTPPKPISPTIEDTSRPGIPETYRVTQQVERFYGPEMPPERRAAPKPRPAAKVREPQACWTMGAPQ